MENTDLRLWWSASKENSEAAPRTLQDRHLSCLHEEVNLVSPKLTCNMAPHSSTPAWKIPWMEEPGRLQSMGSLRVGHDWATSLSLFMFMHWSRKWQPTLILEGTLIFVQSEAQRTLGYLILFTARRKGVLVCSVAITKYHRQSGI